MKELLKNHVYKLLHLNLVLIRLYLFKTNISTSTCINLSTYCNEMDEIDKGNILEPRVY